MLRYGIPQYRLPKVEVLEAEYESVTRLGGTVVCNAGLGRDFTLDDLTNQGFDSVLVAIGCYDTNKLGIPGEDAEASSTASSTCGRRRSACPTRITSASASSSSAAASPRWTARGRRSARAPRGHARLPPRHEGHAGGGRGPRGDRGRRHRHLPGGPTRVITDKTGTSPASSSSGCSSASPTLAGGAEPAPAPSSRSPATASCWPSARAPSSTGSTPGNEGPRRPSSAAQGRRGHVLDRPARRVRTGDVRIGAATVVEAIAEGRRAAYAVDAYLKGWTSTRSAPARRSPSRSPSSCRSCRSPARSRSRATG